MCLPLKSNYANINTNITMLTNMGLIFIVIHNCDEKVRHEMFTKQRKKPAMYLIGVHVFVIKYAFQPHRMQRIDVACCY